MENHIRRQKQPGVDLRKLVYLCVVFGEYGGMYTRIFESRAKHLLKGKSLLLLGPRQVGKSTLLKALNPTLTVNFAREREYLEHLQDPGLIERQVASLGSSGLIFIDEVQRVPSILNTVQALIDNNKKLRFMLSGSSARKLVRGKANLLPGRVISERLYPLTWWELPEINTQNKLGERLIKGMLPGIIDDPLVDDILESYVDAYLKEEVQAEALTRDLGDYSRFLSVAAQCSGQYINYSKMASDTEINKEKIRRYFEILEDTLLIHRIESYGTLSETRKARQKDRFIFFDNGVCHAILKKNRNIFTATELGPAFECWIIQQLIAYNQYYKKNWRIQSYRDDGGLEVDIILSTQNDVYVIEVKYQSRYRSEFGEPLRQFSEFARKSRPKTKFKSIIVYTGETRQVGSHGERVLPLRDFMTWVTEIR